MSNIDGHGTDRGVIVGEGDKVCVHQSQVFREGRNHVPHPGWGPLPTCPSPSPTGMPTAKTLYDILVVSIQSVLEKGILQVL